VVKVGGATGIEEKAKIEEAAKARRKQWGEYGHQDSQDRKTG
jgi:hypothetical protein